MESLLNGTSGPRMNLSMYYDGGNHSRFDMNSVQMNTRIINTNTGPGVGTSVICHGQALNWTCMQVNASISKIFNIFIAPDKAANYTVTALPSRTIAGISASCFNITKMSSPPWAWAAECYSPSGPVLFQQTYMQSGIMTQSTSITALFVSNSVSASDFVPPATPTVLNNTRQSG